IARAATGQSCSDSYEFSNPQGTPFAGRLTSWLFRAQNSLRTSRTWNWLCKKERKKWSERWAELESSGLPLFTKTSLTARSVFGIVPVVEAVEPDASRFVHTELSFVLFIAPERRRPVHRHWPALVTNALSTYHSAMGRPVVESGYPRTVAAT